ncbi:MAG TPA: polyprenyl synthetase family protein, partial [Gemmatimonadaceae bacterium]
LERVPAEMQGIMMADHPLIAEVSRHIQRMQGKLLRPTLALLASRTDGRAEPQAVTLAAALELMHIATLVHDDSVDHSVRRRGLPSINKMFSHEVSVIMGDLLYSRALRALVSLGSLEILRVLTDMTAELAIGEMRQLGAVDRLNLSEAEYFAVISSKTASLLAAACETGALCGAPRFRATMTRYGDRLGMAFQIADDILDYTEDESVTGKPGGLDLKEHKVTLPLIAALPRMSAAGRQRVDELFATQDPSDEQVSAVIEIVSTVGGIDTARQRGEEFVQQAADALAVIPESPVRTALGDVIGYVMERRS